MASELSAGSSTASVPLATSCSSVVVLPHESLPSALERLPSLGRKAPLEQIINGTYRHLDGDRSGGDVFFVFWSEQLIAEHGVLLVPREERAGNSHLLCLIHILEIVCERLHLSDDVVPDREHEGLIDE